jgi:hypothetical protein
MKRFLKSVLIAALVTGVGRANSASPKQSDPSFSITIKAVEPEVKAGAEVYVRVRLTNTSQREIMGGSGFHAQGLDTSYEYNCHDAGGKSVAKEIAPDGSVHDAPILKPGESHEELAPVSRACDLTRPGRYTIQLSRTDPRDPRRTVVKSNTIAILVAP